MRNQTTTQFCLIAVGISGAALPCWAQLPPGLPVPPQNFASTHFFGSPSIVNLQHFALGGAFAADDRNGWHGNPAGMVAVREPTLLVSRNRAGFDLLPTFGTNFLGYAQPFGKDGENVLKITAITVRADGNITGGPVAIGLDSREDDIGIEYARRLSDRLSVGVGTAYLKTQSTYSIAGVGDVTTLRSRPSALGGRVGVIYAISPRISVGATLDSYIERVNRSAGALPVPPDSFHFRSTGYRFGTVYRPTSNLTLLADYEALSLKGNATKVSQRGFMGGAEQRFGPLALRLGSYDGKSTAGLGFKKGRFDLAYGFSGRYDQNLPGRGAKGAHAFQLIAGF